MKSLAKISAILVCMTLLATPHLAEARAGGGGSVGSRGMRTYSAPSYNAAPITRSVTPEPAPAAAQPGYNPGLNPGYAPAAGHPFLSGLAGGFLGAGLFGMLFGHGMYGEGYGMSPGGSMMGGLLQLLLIGALVYFALRWWRQRSGGMGGGFGGYQNPGLDAPFTASLSPSAGMPTPQMRESALAITADDQQSFQQLLGNIQNAWGVADLNHLRQYLTPEMLQYFSETLSANTSRGEVNRIADVTLTNAQLLESWSEYDLDYATVRMQWTAIDYMARLDRQPSDADYVASGSATQPVEAQEIWTFARARSGGHWLLSAIQQVG